jgi:hypothetical protein
VENKGEKRETVEDEENQVEARRVKPGTADRGLSSKDEQKRTYNEDVKEAEERAKKHRVDVLEVHAVIANDDGEEAKVKGELETSTAWWMTSLTRSWTMTRS